MSDEEFDLVELMSGVFKTCVIFLVKCTVFYLVGRAIVTRLGW